MPLQKGKGGINPYLELSLYFNQIQLGTADALYSDGTRYVPALAAAQGLKAFLPLVRNVLVLGTGLGSMVHVLRRKGYSPKFTLVEKDKVVLQWAMEQFAAEDAAKITPVCADAEAFMDGNTVLFDFIFVDVFIGRVVPDFVFGEAFLERCKRSLSPGGHLAFNYLVNDVAEWGRVSTVFSSVFPDYRVVEKGLNRILVGGGR